MRIMQSPGEFKVRKGFTLVKLRSQAKITEGQPLTEAKNEEVDWFNKHKYFRYYTEKKEAKNGFHTKMSKMSPLVQREPLKCILNHVSRASFQSNMLQISCITEPDTS